MYFTDLQGANQTENGIDQFTTVSKLAQNNVLAEVCDDVNAVLRDLAVSEVYKQGNHNVNQLKAFDQLMFISLDE